MEYYVAVKKDKVIFYTIFKWCQNNLWKHGF